MNTNKQCEALAADRRNTRQRRVVLEAVRDLVGSHPTADRVFERVRRDLPGISLSTVYRNLGILAEQGEVLPVRAAGTEVHYDARNEPHCHAQCRKCRRVFDLPAEAVGAGIVRWRGPEQFLVEEVIITALGLCAACRGAAEDWKEQE